MDDKKIELKLEGTTLYVTLGFELTVTNSDALKDMLITYQRQDIREIVFDTTDLVFLSSSGIRTIYFAQQRLPMQSGWKSLRISGRNSSNYILLITT